MKATISNTQLKDALSTASKFCLSRVSSIPSLQGGLIRAKDGHLEITATNLNDFFHTKLKAVVSEEGEGVCDIRHMVDFLSYLKPGDISLSSSATTFIIEAEKTKGTFPLISATDYPTLPNFDGEQIVFDKKTLENLPLVLFAASKDQARPVLTGINFSHKNKVFYMSATDGFRLSLISGTHEKEFEPFTISASILEDTLRLFGEKELSLTISEAEKMVKFGTGETVIYSRLIEGEFPPFARVIPQEHRTKITVSREEFLRNIKLVSVFARDISSTVILDIKKDGMHVLPRGADQSETDIFQELISFEGEEGRIAFNFRFVLDFLNTVGAETIVFETSSSTAPGVFKIEKNNDFIHIIMPIRIEEAL
jgi:DNA polymerase-3 subunit beta